MFICSMKVPQKKCLIFKVLQCSERHPVVSKECDVGVVITEDQDDDGGEGAA